MSFDSFTRMEYDLVDYIIPDPTRWLDFHPSDSRYKEYASSSVSLDTSSGTMLLSMSLRGAAVLSAKILRSDCTSSQLLFAVATC